MSTKVEDMLTGADRWERSKWRASRWWSLSLGALLVAVILLTLSGLAQHAAAQTASKGERGSASFPGPGASGMPNSPGCGLDWTVVASPNALTSTNYLGGIAAVSGNDVWAVGFYFNADTARSLVEHWDGISWTIIPSPNPTVESTYLRAVAAISSSNVWAVGFYYDSSGTQQMLAVHWDGSIWSMTPIPSPGGGDNALSGVAVISSSDVWAVGSYATTSSSAELTLIEHWNGASWSAITGINPSTLTNVLIDVAAISSSDVWAVGFYNSGDTNSDQTLVEHWDGTSWSMVMSPDVGYETNFLVYVAAISSSDVWAVGDYGTGPNTSRTLIEHWNGISWNVVTSPDPGTVSNILVGVAAISSTDVWAVGAYTSLSGSNDKTLIEHWDGTNWSVVTSPIVGTQNNGLYGVAAVSDRDVWAVGISGDGSAFRTLVDHYNPCSTACSVLFEDVPNPSTFYAYVQCLACRGVIGGYSCGGTGEPCNPSHDPYFRPNANVTRGQIAKLIALSAQIYTPVSGQSFEDVHPGSAFYTYTEQLHTLGVMSGYACGGTGEPCNPPANRPYFRPNSSATRGQLAKIDANTAGYYDPPSGRSFQDVPIASTFYTYTQRLTSRGVMSGYACGGTGEPCVPPANLPYFRPNANVTRGQSSKIVANTFYPNCQTR